MNKYILIENANDNQIGARATHAIIVCLNYFNLKYKKYNLNLLNMLIIKSKRTIGECARVHICFFLFIQNVNANFKLEI